ncbi:MAG: DMT family transporter, partial [Candidatus Paceibacterota bacterium]
MINAKEAAMYPMAAIVIGGLITIQNGINSLLSRQVGSLGSAIVIHLVGLATVSLVLLAPQKRYKTGKHPLYLY